MKMKEKIRLGPSNIRQYKFTNKFKEKDKLVQKLKTHLLKPSQNEISKNMSKISNTENGHILFTRSMAVVLQI